MKRNIIVIGASTGGFKALQQLVAGLPPDIDAALFIVWHMAAESINVLPRVLNEYNSIYATTAIDREPIEFNRIYTAPPDKHLILMDNILRLSNGPKENRFRPAIDPLFRSAAAIYGPRVIGVILSGGLDDGTSGLWTVKQYGGIAIVQDPNEAEAPSMPLSAIRHVPVDHKVGIAQMSSLLARLVTEDAPQQKEVPMPDQERNQKEINIALQEYPSSTIDPLGDLTPLTCPECHGVLFSLKESGRLRYRCHTGHAFSGDSLLDAISSNIEDTLYDAIRSIKENIALLNHMGDHFAAVNMPKLAAVFFKKSREAQDRLKLVWQAAINNEHLDTDKLMEESGQQQENR